MAKRVLSDKEINDMYELYKENYSLAKIGELFNVNRKTVSYWFDKKGFEYNKRKTSKTTYLLSDKEIDEAYKLYQEGFSSINLSEMYNVGYETILRGFRRLGYKVRSNKVNSRIYNVNHSYFNEINSAEKAYWLGFIYADGFVTIRKDGCKYFGLSLFVKDVSVLENLKKSLNSNYKINIYKSNGYTGSGEYCRLLIRSDEIVDDLISHGVLISKTNILKPPKLGNNLIRHFIRGYMDGDGSIWRSGREYSVQFLGTMELLDFIMEYFMSNNLVYKKVKARYRKEGQVVMSIAYGGNVQVKRILDHLYLDSNIYLERKFKIYKELANNSQ